MPLKFFPLVFFWKISPTSNMEYPALGTSSEGHGSIALCLVFEFLAIGAIFLRIWSRRLKKTPLAFNDFAALAAIVCDLDNVKY